MLAGAGGSLSIAGFYEESMFGEFFSSVAWTRVVLE